jgi:hypothetical protein
MHAYIRYFFYKIVGIGDRGKYARNQSGIERERTGSS